MQNIREAIFSSPTGTIDSMYPSSWRSRAVFLVPHFCHEDIDEIMTPGDTYGRWARHIVFLGEFSHACYLSILTVFNWANFQRFIRQRGTLGRNIGFKWLGFEVCKVVGSR
jgi:hypothetical protein